MRCYIATAIANPEDPPHIHEWTADVITSQDYHERGPHAHSYRTDPHPSASIARESAESWAREHGNTVVPVASI